MEDEQRDTQKKKIQILFQLGKWSDVVKLCSSYAEKYGKDMEIDMIRFKSERHLGVASPVPPAGELKPAAPTEPVQPAAAEATIVSDPSIPLIPPEKEEEPSPIGEEVEPGGVAKNPAEIDLGDPFSGDDLVISDPFASDEPPVTMAAEEGAPVEIGDSEAPAVTKLEFADGNDISTGFAEEPEADLQPEEKEPDLSGFGGLTIDAEPDLSPAAADLSRIEPPPEKRHEPPAEAQRRAVGTMYGGAAAEAKPFSPPPVRPHAADEAAPARMIPPDQEGRAEKPQSRPSPYSAASETPTAEPGKRLNVKLLLFIILPLLVAAALWLVLSGRLGPGPAAEEPRPAAQPARPAPPRRRPAPVKPAATAPTPALDAQAAEQEKKFADTLLQAEELERKGETLKAWALVLEAKKIKVSEPLQQLEERLARKMQEEQAQAQKEKQTALSQWELETQALAKAKEADTIAGWQAFLRDYPQSESAPAAEARITALEKKAQEAAQQQLLQRIQLEQKLRPRAAYASLSPAEAAALARPGGRPPARFEPHAHGNATVTLELNAGLMWSLYNRPMAFDKARWWANRVTAGYSGWRLPTAEEALALLQTDRGQYAGMAGFAVWTGDTVSDQPRAVWVLKLPEGQFVPGPENEVHYVWAVRKAGR